MSDNDKVLKSLTAMSKKFSVVRDRGFAMRFKPSMKDLALVKAAGIRNKDGQVSGLTAALLGGKGPDKDFKWVKTDNGGYLQMAGWVRGATNNVFDLDDLVRQRVLERMSVLPGRGRGRGKGGLE